MNEKRLNKTLSQLVNYSDSVFEYDSYLVKTVNQLQNKKISQYEIEDLRIMIGQNLGLKYLIPLAIIKLEENLFAEGHFYPGDLLKAVLDIEVEYWKKNKKEWQKVNDLIKKHLGKLEKHKILFEKFQSAL